MKKLFLILLLILSIGSCRSGGNYFSENPEEEDPILTEEKTGDYETQSLYEVTRSDSVASIARKYGVSVDDIIANNNLKRPYILRPGTLINVPTVKMKNEFSNSEGQEDLANPQKVIQIGPSKKKKGNK